MFGFGRAINGTRTKRWKRREGEGKEETLTDKPGDFENHARQRTGRLIGSASRTLITCVGQRFDSYWEVCLFWSARFFGSRFISRAAKPKIPLIYLSFLRNQTETLATHVTKIYVSHPWIGCIRKRSYTEFGMPVLQKETPGRVNVCWMESAPWRPSFHLKITCYSHANELISIFVIVH